MNVKHLLAALAVLAVPSLAHAETPLNPDIAYQAQERIDKDYHLGTVIGVIDKNGPRYYGFGRMSLSNAKTPDLHSIFEIGSIAKVYTATLLADLERSGDLKITTPLETIVTEARHTVQTAGRTVTLENLMTHTAGLPRNPTNTDDNDDDRYKEYTAEDLKGFLTSYRITPENTGFYYSNTGTLVLEHAIETKTNMSYENLMQKRIFKPLGLKNTYFRAPESKQHLLVTGYRNGEETEPVDVGSFPAMGGILTSTEDILTFLGAHLGLIETPIQAAAAATHKVRFKNDERMMGLGWSIQKNETSGKTILYHKGGTNGFVSFAGINLEDKIGVVVLVNGRNWFSDMGFKILDPTYELKENIPPREQ